MVFLGNAQQIVSANSAAEAIQLCKEKAAKSPKELREQMLSSCICEAKNTDFKKVKALSAAGKKQELQALYQKAAKSCL